MKCKYLSNKVNFKTYIDKKKYIELRFSEWLTHNRLINILQTISKLKLTEAKHGKLPIAMYNDILKLTRILFQTQKCKAVKFLYILGLFFSSIATHRSKAQQIYKATDNTTLLSKQDDTDTSNTTKTYIIVALVGAGI